MRRHAALLAALLAACSSDIEPAQPLLNQCTQPFDCGPLDACDPDLKLCVRERADAPYPVAFQVVPGARSSTLVDRLTLDTQQLESRLALGEVRVPKAVVLSGRVLAEGSAREAALTIVPRGARPYLSVPISTQTLPPPGGGELRFGARLEPNVAYDVRVYPLGADAALLPPNTFEVTTGAGDSQVDLTYGADLRQSFRGKLLDANAVPQAGRKLRLRTKATGETVSSLGTVAADGSFVLYTKASVLARRSDHELQVGLEARREPWLTSLSVDGARLRPDGNVTIPAVPAPVRFIGGVEVDDRTSAAVTFQSRFLPPSEQTRVNGRDWCRASLDAGITCSAELTVPLTAGTGEPGTPPRPGDRRVTVDLLPGDYQVFVRPVNEGSDAPAPATTASTLGIETQPDAGAQAGYSFPLDLAKVYSGRVLSPLDKAMPFVTITAEALGLPGNPSEVGAVGRYNRTAEALSDRNGDFKLSVDLGYYDFVARPPTGSGFAWSLWANRIIDDIVADLALISPDAPVIARGTLLTSDGQPIPEARVDAFAVVRDLRTDGERAVRIGQAISNDAGVFVLHLPARVLDDPGRDGGMDGGAADLDAGI